MSGVDRREELLDERWAPGARATFDGIEAAMGRVPNLHRVLAASPDLLSAWFSFSQTVRTEPSAPRRLRELAIMRVAQLEGADYVWCSHWGAATVAGVDPDVLARLESWPELGLGDVEQALLRFVDSCIAERGVPAPRWNDLVAACSLDQALELAVTVCWYLCVTRLTQVLNVPAEDTHGEVPPR